MSQGVRAQDLFKLKSVSQALAADDQVYFVENSIDAGENRYLAKIKRADRAGHVQDVATNGQLNLQPAIAADCVYYAAKVGAAKPQLFAVATTGDVPTLVTTATPDEAVNTVIAAADGRSVYFKTTETAELPKLPNQEKFPWTRRVTRLINKADDYGW